jgi:hypothetical protein
VAPTVEPGTFNSMMPWAYYAHMNEEDLKAIFTYLQSIPPVKNQVVKFDAPAN